MKRVRRMVSSDRFKMTECTHSCTSLLYVHYKLSSDYRQKRRLRIQNRSAGCVLSFTNPSRQQEVPKLYMREQSLSVIRVIPFGLNTAPQVFTHLGQTVAGYLHRQGISVMPYLNDWLVHHQNRQVLLCHQS